MYLLFLHNHNQNKLFQENHKKNDIMMETAIHENSIHSFTMSHGPKFDRQALKLYLTCN